LIAVAFSPLSPIGEARQMDPSLGFFVNPHIGLGMAATAISAAALTTLGTITGARRVRSVAFRSVSPASQLVRRARLRPTMATGVRMALELRGGTSALALLGILTGLSGLIAALVFSSSLRHLDRTPSLVGWNWDMAAFLHDIEPDGVAGLRDRYLSLPGVKQASLASWFPPQFSLLGESSVPMAFTTGVDSIRPTVIEGRAPAGPDEVLLSAGFAKRLNRSVGDAVDLRRADPTDPNKPSGSTARFEVVGIGVLPIGDGRIDIGFGLTLDGLSALVPGSGPHLVLLNLHAETDRQLVKAALERDGHAESVIDRTPSSFKLVQLNAEQVGSTPRIVAGLFAGTAAAVLIHGLISSGRKRRREFAIFKTIGFTARQTTAASVWHAVTSTLIALVIAIPIGSAVGAGLWSLYAESLGVKVEVSTALVAIGVVAAGSLAGAAIVAFWPAWLAARRGPAATLRTE
jgi:putative ABC transport system permease protein